MKIGSILRVGAVMALAIGSWTTASAAQVDSSSDRDCPDDDCIPLDGVFSDCVEFEYRRPALPDRPLAGRAEWVTDDSGQQVAEARERDNGTGDDDMADPDVSTDGESATVCIYNVGYLTDSSGELYDLFPWACLEIYVRFQYRFPVTRYVYKTVNSPDGSSRSVLKYTYLDWEYAWMDTCVTQVCICPPASEDGE